jgi:hypothetical protein
VNCEFCGRTIKREIVEKVLRGKKHIFCTEGCFNLYFYNIPDFSYEKLYAKYCETVPVNLTQIAEDEK